MIHNETRSKLIDR